MGVNIKILNPKKTKNPSNCYIVEIQFMHGDADAYTNKTSPKFNLKHIEELKEFIMVCQRMTEAYPHGRGGYDDYDEDVVPGYDKWFGGEDYDGPKNRLGIEMEYSCVCEGGHATFQSYEVYYYDENGIKHPTLIEFKEEKI